MSAQVPTGSSESLDVDNSAAFVQYQSPYTISSFVADYKKANKPSPVIVSHPIPTHGGGSIPGRNSVYPSQHLIDLSWRSPLIVVVHFTAQKTFMLDDHSFLYSNFLGVVEDVLKDKDRKFAVGDGVLVTRAGGEQTIDGMLVRAIDPEFAPFKEGSKYLLFLDPVPGTNFYKSYAHRSFQLGNESEGEAKAMDAHPLQPLSEVGSHRTAPFLDEVRQAIMAAAQDENERRPQ